MTDMTPTERKMAWSIRSAGGSPMCACRSPTAATCAAAIAWRRQMQFLPRRDLLSFEEIAALADIFIARGVTRIRLTGGEPLVRRGSRDLVGRLGERIGRRPRRADPDDQRHPARPVRGAIFARRACGGSMSASTAATRTASATSPAAATSTRCSAGSRRPRRRGSGSRSTWSRSRASTRTRSRTMLRWCAGQGHDLTLIETMPLGEVEEDRTDHYLPLDAVKRRLEQRFTLIPSLRRTGGPARYYDVGGARHPARPDHAADRQFLRRLQPHPRGRDRHGLWLPRPGPEGRAARPAAQRRPGRGRRGARPADRRQAQGP